MKQSELLGTVPDQILAYLEERKAQNSWCKSTMRRFTRELVQMMYRYLNARDLEYAQIFDDHEFMHYEERAIQSEAGCREFILYLFEKLEGNEGQDICQENVVMHLKEYIEQHLGDDLSRNVLAKEVYLSVGYISKIFLKGTGIPLQKYIAERRIEKAKEYLIRSNLPVSRIASQVGYNNFSYFSKTFRDLTGCTPNEYRSNYKHALD